MKKRLGIISLVLSCCYFIGLFVFLPIGMIIELMIKSYINSGNLGIVGVLNIIKFLSITLIVVFVFIFPLIGFILGIFTLVKKKKDKGFAIAGAVISLIALLTTGISLLFLVLYGGAPRVIG